MGGAVNLLAIETATPACGVGVRTSGGVELARVVDENRRHTEVLTLAMEELLVECGLSARDIARVVVDRGPGLFTGLRVGIATANAFAQAIGCGLVSVTSLELLAHGAHGAGVRGTLVAGVDGRRGEIFVQTFSLAEEVEAISEPAVALPRDVVIRWATNGAAVTFTGDGVERYSSDFCAVPNAEVFAQSVPPVHAALQLGSLREAEGSVTPLYLREADAVANFTTRERPR
jgi:tRNA threonylcarbamoyladenosine biosynthesis protein TsaB